MRQSLRIPLVRSPGGGGLRYVCVNGDAEVMKLRKAIREARGGRQGCAYFFIEIPTWRNIQNDVTSYEAVGNFSA